MVVATRFSSTGPLVAHGVWHTPKGPGRGGSGGSAGGARPHPDHRSCWWLGGLTWHYPPSLPPPSFPFAKPAAQGPFSGLLGRGGWQRVCVEVLTPAESHQVAAGPRGTRARQSRWWGQGTWGGGRSGLLHKGHKPAFPCGLLEGRWPPRDVREAYKSRPRRPTLPQLGTPRTSDYADTTTGPSFAYSVG